METAVQEFLDSVYVRSHSDETVKTYGNCIKKFKQFLASKYEIELHEIVSKIKKEKFDVYKIFNEFVVFQDKSGLKPRSIHLSVNAVKSFLRHCGIKIYSEDFKHSVRMPKRYSVQETPITKEVIVRLLRNVSPKLQTVILVAVSTGMRVGELVQFRISDIDFESKPVKIRLRAEITKTRTAREVFLTSEAVVALKDYLKRYHRWDKGSSVKPKNTVFGRTSISKNPLRDESSLKQGPCIAAKSLLQKSFEASIKKIPEFDARMENGKRVIHFHAFRKFFRTTVGNVCGRDYAEALMGHSFYLDTYYQLPDEKKREMFLEVEPYLTISDFVAVEKNIKKLSEKNTQLEEKFNDLLQYLRSNSIEVPN